MKKQTPYMTQCLIRILPHIHKRAKLKAYDMGLTLQKWVGDLIEAALNKDEKYQPKEEEKLPSVLDDRID